MFLLNRLALAVSLVICGLEGTTLFAADVSSKGAAKPQAVSHIGHVVPNFVLADAQGKKIALADFHDKPVVVAIFLGTGCPIGNAYIPYLTEMQKQFSGQGVQFLVINSQAGDTPAEIAKHADQYKLTIPVLCDPNQQVANLFGAERLAQAFVLDFRRTIRYAGRIDDRIGYGTKKEKPTRNDLTEAITQILDRKDVSVKETPVQGCLITRREISEKKEQITYASHVSKILTERCQNCHHKGTAAPFALLTYDDAVNWSAMIREVITEKRMPPWHADPRFGKFSNDCSLTPQELESVVAWIDQGTPEGDKSKLAAPKSYSDGWMIGKPDIVFQLPEEVKVQSTGVVRYKYFSTKTNFKEDTWIEAAEARPGNRAVVHHIIVFYRTPGMRGPLDDSWVVAYAPGSAPLELKDGLARKIPAGAELIWQVHYTPTGKEELDRSELAFKFYSGKEAPKHNVKTRGLYNRRLSIPPEDPHYRVASSMTFKEETTILAFMPHMHLRGKSFEYKMKYPDGRQETVLSVPQYDFNWQNSYVLEKPLVVPQGTQLECVAFFDNSPNNPANPNPKETVRWGEQTWNEMMIGYFEYYSAHGDGKGSPASEGKKPDRQTNAGASKEANVALKK
ncbi:MAG: redoxin domain-containing protein [Planctomycetales bacterium]